MVVCPCDFQKLIYLKPLAAGHLHHATYKDNTNLGAAGGNIEVITKLQNLLGISAIVFKQMMFT